MSKSVPQAPPPPPPIFPPAITITLLLLNSSKIPQEIAALDGLWPPLTHSASNMGHKLEPPKISRPSTFPPSSWWIARLLAPMATLAAEEAASLPLGNI